MSNYCSDKHNNNANKFCPVRTQCESIECLTQPECGQKLEHLDIDKLNEEYTKFVEECSSDIEKLRNHGIPAFIKCKNIETELYYYNKKFHTKQQTLEELKIDGEKDSNKYFFNKYGTTWICVWPQINAEKCIERIMQRRHEFRVDNAYKKIFKDLNTEKEKDSRIYYFINDIRDAIKVGWPGHKEYGVEEMKNLLKKFSEEL